MVTDLRVPLDAGASTGATHYHPVEGRRAALLVLAHGAGAGQRHPFIVAFAHGLAARGVDVVTFDFPYMEQKRRVPDRAPVLERCFRAVVDAACARNAVSGHRLFIGGKSMGGRMATHLAAQGMDDLAGIVVLGYPLHPPGKPEQQRTAHLPDIVAPLLIVQGERDAFGTPAELRPVLDAMLRDATLHVVPRGDHSLAVPGAARQDVYDTVLTTITAWMDAVDRRAGPGASA